MEKEHLYQFVKSYLKGATELFEKDQPTSEFSRGYQKALVSLKEILDKMEPAQDKEAA